MDLGEPHPKNTAAVVGAIKQAVHLAQSGRIAGLVTNPIHKATLMGAEFPFPGHTEFLGALFGNAPTTMMLVIDGLRVVPVTVHLALKQVPEALSTEAIIRSGLTTAAALQKDFGIPSPRLAVAALNPHAGESGRLGDEEERIISPAVEYLRQEGIQASGPLASDTLFHAEARREFDAVLCMYHDQALIPLKTLDFSSGVNVTLGLPIVRTSPDHGTAFDIAAKGKANPSSFLAALKTAHLIAECRASVKS